ncbi:1-acyl-sn-glycerol-3-phosphate acyltransferase [Rhodoferax saidenbachensis]|uniref:Phospholipid/glycerol acyltransferase domain-containing protein n=1 Tax=Rhodoferax saidenbachensis TaxID=1484693 RepID=A0A1P8K9V1_9BURK|nr:1-acyl-sn-glycerol-3-phosphate acyltransferase [Rhodoferax saidenbachensis]APW42755.1 hypothetical protein RS694_09575 [Rhodoferax saidenbachensis]
MTGSDFEKPYAVQVPGSALARWVLARFGWQVQFEGLPALQGVMAVYPHTSNWDFVVLILAKWSAGVQLRFWGKDTLFRIPLFGRWLRLVGGVPVIRNAPRGVVGQAVDTLAQAKANQQFFWLGLAPEGTRKPGAGWRSGFYQSALQAGVPLGLVSLDYGRRLVNATHFLKLSGDLQADFARIAAIMDGVCGHTPANAAPVRLLEK